MKSYRTAFLAAVLLAMVNGFTPLAGQSSTDNTDPQFGQRRNQSPFDEKLERDRLKAMNKDRYESLKKDTDELLKLSTELKSAVDKANENTLSVEVIRKTEEVEKLAKKVRDKMKASYVPLSTNPISDR